MANAPEALLFTAIFFAMFRNALYHV